MKQQDSLSMARQRYGWQGEWEGKEEDGADPSCFTSASLDKPVD